MCGLRSRNLGTVWSFANREARLILSRRNFTDYKNAQAKVPVLRDEVIWIADL
jgi:hypothetical protein